MHRGKTSFLGQIASCTPGIILGLLSTLGVLGIPIPIQ